MWIKDLKISIFAAEFARCFWTKAVSQIFICGLKNIPIPVDLASNYKSLGNSKANKIARESAMNNFGGKKGQWKGLISIYDYESMLVL